MIIIHEVIIDKQIIHTHVLLFVVKHTSVTQPRTSFISHKIKYIVINYQIYHHQVKQIHHHQVSNISS